MTRRPGPYQLDLAGRTAAERERRRSRRIWSELAPVARRAGCSCPIQGGETLVEIAALRGCKPTYRCPILETYGRRLADATGAIRR